MPSFPMWGFPYSLGAISINDRAGCGSAASIFHTILAWHLTCCPMRFDAQRPACGRMSALQNGRKDF